MPDQPRRGGSRAAGPRGGGAPRAPGGGAHGVGRRGEAVRQVPGRSARRKVLSQNFLVDRRVIESLAAGAGPGPGDLVLDIGAGNGLITEAVRRRGARVTAIERDPALARKLRSRFAGDQDVTVVEADILAMELPREPYSVVANLPFGITTKILRHLLGDPAGLLRRADVIVQAEVARKRGTRGRGTLLNASWEPWFEFRTGQRIPPSAFRPQPRVDAAVLLVRRRDPPLLSPARQREYERFVTAAFTGARPTVASAMAAAIPRSRFAGLADRLGFAAGALPSQLDAGQWVGLFLAAATGPARPAGRRAPARPDRSGGPDGSGPYGGARPGRAGRSSRSGR
jgi:23S rRNA (adenine-N6)-dimethyltransferase